jgi:uncharacterized protein (DUF433 family)
MSSAVDIGTLIVRTPGTMGGRPRIGGSRITVGTIALLVGHGVSPEEIVTSYYHHLSLAQVYAALAYYHANREEVDADLAEADQEYLRLAEQQRNQGRGASRA